VTQSRLDHAGQLGEDEAYTFGSEIARMRGGDYCQDLSSMYASFEEQRDIALRVDPCAARPSALTWLVAH
jgi:hypothetical protein